MLTKMLVKNLKPYSITVFSWNERFLTLTFKADETLDCTGIEINTEENFNLFVKNYVTTNIVTLIPIYITDIDSNIILEDGYFDYDYVEYGWVV